MILFILVLAALHAMSMNSWLSVLGDTPMTMYSYSATPISF